MPYLVQDGDVIEVKFFCHCNGQLGINRVRYFIDEVSIDGVNLDELAEHFAALGAICYNDAINNDAEYLGVKVTCPWVLPLPASSIAYDTVPGTGGASPAPGQVSGVLTLKTDIAGRANRGRIYVPFPAEEETEDNGTPSPDYVGRLEDIGAAILVVQIVTGAVGSCTAAPAVCRGDGTVNGLVTSYQGRNQWGTQRRRGGYGQTNPAVIT